MKFLSQLFKSDKLNSNIAWIDGIMGVDTLNHNCNDHYELKNYTNFFNCDGCKTKGYGRRYRCDPCGRQLHRECRFPTTTISHEYFPGSAFTFRRLPLTRLDRNNRLEFSKCCSACRKDICGFSYRCDATDKDLHPTCKNLEKMLLVDDTVFDLHAGVRSKCFWCKKRRITGAERDVRGWTYVYACNKYHFHVFCMVEIMHEACMRSGEVGLENVGIKDLVKYRGSDNKFFKTIKFVLKLISAVFLGDPTALAADFIAEMMSRGFNLS